MYSKPIDIRNRSTATIQLFGFASAGNIVETPGGNGIQYSLDAINWDDYPISPAFIWTNEQLDLAGMMHRGHALTNFNMVASFMRCWVVLPALEAGNISLMGMFLTREGGA